MSHSNEEDSKEGNVESNSDSDRGDIKSVLPYALRSFGIALLLLGVVFSAMHFFNEFNSSAGLMVLVAESLKKSLELIFLSLVGAIVGPFLAVTYNSGYILWYFLVVFALAIVLFGVGCQFWKRWWGQSLGVVGVFLWLLAGFMSLGQHA